MKDPKNPFAELGEIIGKVYKDLGAISFVDILLNHTAVNSPWLLEIPDSYYTVKNTPHLACALLLDEELAKFN